MEFVHRVEKVMGRGECILVEEWVLLECWGDRKGKGKGVIVRVGKRGGSRKESGKGDRLRSLWLFVGGRMVYVRELRR